MQVLTVLSGTASLKTKDREDRGVGERTRETEKENAPLGTLQQFAFTCL